MKRNLLLAGLSLLLTVGWLSVQAQNSTEILPQNPDDRLVEAFGKADVEQLEKVRPRSIAYYNFYLDHAYRIVEMPTDKSDYLASLRALDIDPNASKSEINVLKFKLNLTHDKQTSFRMRQSNKIMVFYSGEEFNKMFEEHLDSQNSQTNQK